MSTTSTLQNDLATMRDSLGRLFDAKKFAARFDAIGRWVNARAGRKRSKTTAKRSPARSSAMSTKPAPATETPAPAAAPTPEATAIPAAEALPETSAPAPAAAPVATPAPAEVRPDFADMEKAAGPEAAPAVEGKAQGEPEAAPMTTAETIINIIQTALVLIGDDEGVLSPTEKLMLRPPLERVLRKYDVGADVLPAEVDLAVALAVIVIARLKKPKTATFFAKVRAWFGGKVMEAKGRALAANVKAATS